MNKKAIIIVLDSVGIGELPDAANYGDKGADTLGHIINTRHLRIFDGRIHFFQFCRQRSCGYIEFGTSLFSYFSLQILGKLIYLALPFRQLF